MPSPDSKSRHHWLTLFATSLLVVATLHFGREFLIPIALSILISFLLVPLVRRLECCRLPRVAAVLSTTLLAFASLGLLGYVMTGQMLDLADRLPGYKSNLDAKIVALKPSGKGPLARAAETLKELSAELNRREPTTSARPGTRTAEGIEPMPVSVVSGPQGAAEQLVIYGLPAAHVLGVAVIVVIFVNFMLLCREDLRDRLVHLIGRSRLRGTTRALDEAGGRVSRYLNAQLMTNSGYGVLVATGLYFIGVPNAVLWGLLAGVLRFIPYLGPWIGASFPLALSLAASPGWIMPLWTLGLFLALELTTANVVEPHLYGSLTGLSPIAVLIAATFWVSVWGILGLLLSTPLTVCLLVLGRHVAGLTFLEVLLSDEPPIAEADRIYQRLLADDAEELSTMAGAYARAHSVGEAFEDLLIPALRLADEDLHLGDLTESEWHRMLTLTRELIAGLGAAPASALPGPAKPTAPAVTVYCLPVSDEADEVVGLMLARLLELQGVCCEVLSARSLASEMIEEIARHDARVLCLSVLPPASVRHALLYLRRLREHLPEARITVGVWGEAPGDDSRLKRLAEGHPDALHTTLAATAKELAATVSVTPRAESPAAA